MVSSVYSQQETDFLQRSVRFCDLKVLVAGLIFTIIAVSATAWYTARSAREQAQRQAEQYLISVSREMQTGFDSARMLSMLVYESDGELKNFDYMARVIVTQNPSIYAALLAPQGHVEYAYPAERMADCKVHFFQNPDWRDQAAFDSQHHFTRMLGPVGFRHDVQGLLIRQPVYLGNTKYPDQFWGFTVIAMNVDRLLERSRLTELTQHHFDYELSEVTDAGTETLARKVKGKFLEPVTVQTNMYGRTWQLQVEMENGWIFMPLLVVMTFVLLLVAVLVSMLRQNVIKLNQKNDMLERASNIDPLTQIYNRRGFEEAEREMFREAEHILLSVIDVNEFKSFNDLYGHAAGDAVLKQLARELQELAVPFDGVAGRSGGDEFALLLPVTLAEGEQALQDFAQRAHSFTYAGRDYAFALSLGYAEYPEQASSSADLGRKADIAVYHAKLNREEHCCHYQANLASETRNKMGFNINDLTKGLPAGILVTYAMMKSSEILFANDELAHIAGYESGNEIVGKFWQDFIYEPDAPRVWQQARLMQENGTAEDSPERYYAYRIRRTDGRLCRVVAVGRIVHHAHFGDVFYVLFYRVDRLPAAFRAAQDEKK